MLVPFKVLKIYHSFYLCVVCGLCVIDVSDQTWLQSLLFSKSEQKQKPLDYIFNKAKTPAENGDLARS